MKKVAYYIGLIGFLAFLLLAPVLVFAQDPVKAESANGATTVGIDVLSPWRSTKSFVAQNWGKILLGVGGAIAVDRVADHNDWLWYEGRTSKPGKATEPIDAPKPDTGSVSQSAGGNASQTTITATDNSTVNITIVGDAL